MSNAVERFGDLTDAAAARWGDREALVFRDRRYTFRQIAAEVDRVARGLIHVGVQPGEKVALWLLNCPEWIFAMFALAKIGAVHVPINTRFRTVDLAQVLERSNAATLITHDVSGPVDYLGMVRELASLDGDGENRRVRSASAPRSGARGRRERSNSIPAPGAGPSCWRRRARSRRPPWPRGPRRFALPTPCSSCTRRGRPDSRRA